MKQHTWKNVQELFSVLNKECNYLILRNYEEIEENKFLVDAHPDIDLLCDNPRKLKSCIKHVPNPGRLRHKDHYWVKIGQHLVAIGIRSVGDCYYDPKWAQDMLDTRILHSSGFYTMDAMNYFYSLIYHAAFQKKNFADDYLTRLHSMANGIIAEPHAETEESYTTLLLHYMKKKNYYVTCPRDITIPLQFNKIPDELLHGKQAWKCRRILHLPERLMRFIIRRLQKL